MRAGCATPRQCRKTGGTKSRTWLCAYSTAKPEGGSPERGFARLLFWQVALPSRSIVRPDRGSRQAGNGKNEEERLTLRFEDLAATYSPTP